MAEKADIKKLYIDIRYEIINHYKLITYNNLYS